MKLDGSPDVYNGDTGSTASQESPISRSGVDIPLDPSQYRCTVLIIHP